MNWVKKRRQIPRQMAVPGEVFPYYGDKSLFLDNYKALIDFCAETAIPYILIWGFLRDSHGGVDTSIELCNYAHQNNIKIIAGVGTQGYGGVYYDGNNEFNSACWLTKHPELTGDAVLVQQNAIIEVRGKCLCPSHPKNREWLCKGVEWLLNTIPVDGVDLENGDYISCACSECNKRRTNIKDIYDLYFRSITLSYQPIIEFITQNYPDIFIINTLYTGFTHKFLENHSGLFSLADHKNTYNLWTLTNLVKQSGWDIEINMQNKNNLAYLHYFSSANNSQQTIFVKEIYEILHKLGNLDFKGAAIYGEESAYSEVGLLNYLTFAECIKTPNHNYDYLINELLPLALKKYGTEMNLTADIFNDNNQTHIASRGI